jgi:hypothetical protein
MLKPYILDLTKHTFFSTKRQTVGAGLRYKTDRCVRNNLDFRCYYIMGFTYKLKLPSDRVF